MFHYFSPFLSDNAFNCYCVSSLISVLCSPSEKTFCDHSRGSFRTPRLRIMLLFLFFSFFQQRVMPVPTAIQFTVPNDKIFHLQAPSPSFLKPCPSKHHQHTAQCTKRNNQALAELPCQVIRHLLPCHFENIRQVKGRSEECPEQADEKDMLPRHERNQRKLCVESAACVFLVQE